MDRTLISTNKASYAAFVNRRKRVGGKSSVVEGTSDERLLDVIPANPVGGLGEIVGAEREKSACSAT